MLRCDPMRCKASSSLHTMPPTLTSWLSAASRGVGGSTLGAEAWLRTRAAAAAMTDSFMLFWGGSVPWLGGWVRGGMVELVGVGWASAVAAAHWGRSAARKCNGGGI